MIIPCASFGSVILIVGTTIFLPHSSASIKQEIPDLNIPIGIDDTIQPHYLGFRPRTHRDKQLQALMKIQKKVRSTAMQNIRPITQKEKKLQSIIKLQKDARATSQTPSVSMETPSSIDKPQFRVRTKTKPQYPTYL